MSSHTMDTLRGHLFDALDGLKTGTLDVSVARAMSGVAQTIIESAKAEAAFARATGQRVESTLINVTPAPALLGAPPSAPAAPPSAPAAPIERKKIATGTLERQGNVTRHIAR